MTRALQCHLPLSLAGRYAAVFHADMENLTTLDRENNGRVFSDFISNTSQHFLFSRDPAYVSTFDDFILSFQSRNSRTTHQHVMISYNSQSEGTFCGERVAMNSTRSSLTVQLINTRPSGHMRERKDLIHRSYNNTGILIGKSGLPILQYNLILTRFGCEDCPRRIRSYSRSRIVRSFLNYQSWLQAELLALLPGSFWPLGGPFGHRWHHCSTRKRTSTVRACCGGRGRKRRWLGGRNASRHMRSRRRSPP